MKYVGREQAEGRSESCGDEHEPRAAGRLDVGCDGHAPTVRPSSNGDLISSQRPANELRLRKSRRALARARRRVLRGMLVELYGRDSFVQRFAITRATSGRATEPASVKAPAAKTFAPASVS